MGKWKDLETYAENYHLRVVLQEGDVDGVKPRRLVLLNEDNDELFIIREFIGTFAKLPLLAWCELARQLDRNHKRSYDNGFTCGQEDVFRTSRRLHGADVIAEQIVNSLGNHY